jgi:hypothetical protein
MRFVPGCLWGRTCMIMRRETGFQNAQLNLAIFNNPALPLGRGANRRFGLYVPSFGRSIDSSWIS